MNITVNVLPDYREDRAGGAVITFTEPVTFVELTQEGKEGLIALLQAIPSVQPHEVAAQSSSPPSPPSPLTQQLEASITEEELGANLCDEVTARFIRAGMHSFQGQSRQTSELDVVYAMFDLAKGSLATMDKLAEVALAKVDELIREAEDDGYDTIIWRRKPQYNDGKLSFRYHFALLRDWRAKVSS